MRRLAGKQGGRMWMCRKRRENTCRRMIIKAKDKIKRKQINLDLI
jgi:hypothetical protein